MAVGKAQMRPASKTMRKAKILPSAIHTVFLRNTSVGRFLTSFFYSILLFLRARPNRSKTDMQLQTETDSYENIEYKPYTANTDTTVRTMMRVYTGPPDGMA